MPQPPERIRVDNFLVADSAQALNGKLFVLGGGWNYLNLAGPNAEVALTLAGRVVVPWAETNRDLPFPIHLIDPSGEDLLRDPFKIRLLLRPKPALDQPPSIETATPFTVDFYGLSFPRPGEYAFTIEHEGEELARARFQVNFFAPET